MKRPTYPDYIQDQFDRDVAEHQMEILLDRGLYRHLRFKRPSTGLGYFDLVTWPGHLAIGGNREAFTFAREKDMFGFFRAARSSRINPDYWAEKVTDGRERTKRYSEELAKEAIWSAVRHEYEASGKTAKGLARAVQEEIVSEFEYGLLPDEPCVRDAVAGFTFRRKSGLTFRFFHSQEWNLRDWDHHYLWACHAIVWGIARYDARELTPKQWLEISHADTDILDYDGWAGKKWHEPITRKEFERRLSLCTISIAAPAAAGEVAS